ncbi:MAG: LysR family transcriptional regulator [Ferrovibrio sp.]|jgi:DNA-binding transcriptional LysR family regulator|nr:LysR family transcriptional regulator [Ferrovibrio sp.]
MQLRHLEIFHAVMLTGTITAAAKLMNISQPAATRLLLRAEDQLRYKLFDRVRGRLLPTKEALILQAESEKLIAGLENLRKLARNLGTASSGHLRIAAAPALCLELVPLAITRFRQKHKDVTFEVETRQYADLVRTVLTQEVDIGIGFDIPPHPGLELAPLAQGHFFGAFPAAQEKSLPHVVKLNYFTRQPFIGLRSDDPLGSVFSAVLNLAGVKLDPIVEVKTNQVALALVEKGAGAAIVDQYTAAARNPAKVAIRRLQPSIPFAVQVMRPKHGPPGLLAGQFGAALTWAEKSIATMLSAPAA